MHINFRVCIAINPKVNIMQTKTARFAWTELNTMGFHTAEDLRAALAAFDSGVTAQADEDIAEFNRNNDELTLTRSSWRAGIADAIAFIEAA